MKKRLVKPTLVLVCVVRRRPVYSGILASLLAKA